MRTAELDYDLPEHLIAQCPLPARDGARMLLVDPMGASIANHRIADLPDLLAPALWIVNDTRVIPARLLGHKASGGRVEILLVELIGGDERCARYRCMGRASKGLRPGLRVQLAPEFSATVLGKVEDGMFEVELRAPAVAQAIERHGHLPLPPYIDRAPVEEDRTRYQTVYATHPGAVAAPTAGLHLSTELLARLQAAGHQLAKVTLHVGPGTFAPLRAPELSQHPMHAEHYQVPEETVAAIAAARAEGRPVLAVGTTVVRTLEAAATEAGMVGAGPGKTSLLIYPPYRFKVVDTLLTNFHLPRSTLLALVMAFGGVSLVRAAYEAAVADRYRFFSYGDAMLIRRPG